MCKVVNAQVCWSIRYNWMHLITSLDDGILPTTRDRQLRLKPVLVQDTDYMVEKADQLAPYVGYLMPCMVSIRYLECGGQLTLSSIWSKSH